MTPIDEEDRILRVWTPLILRTILIVSAIILLAGIVAMATWAPGYYVERFHAAQVGATLRHEVPSWSVTAQEAVHGNPHALMTLGLLVLTLVPLGRVAFTFFLFAKEGDRVFTLATAYVLAGLIAGVMLGRIG
jgi:uncharacterized membrane protein